MRIARLALPLVFLLATATAFAQKTGDTLPAGKFLKTGEYLFVAGKYAILQPDGNFCSYWGDNPSKQNGLIGCVTTKASGLGAYGAYFAMMQDDGNFCIYRGTDPAHRAEGYVWCRAGRKETAPGPYKLVMRSDGDLVVLANGGLVWALDGRSGITTWNTYSNRYVWFTIYDELKTTNLDYGCVKPGQSRKWTNSRIQNSGAETRFYVRAQVMETPDCKGKQYCDTTGEILGANSIYVNEDKAKASCYLDKYRR